MLGIGKFTMAEMLSWFGLTPSGLQRVLNMIRRSLGTQAVKLDFRIGFCNVPSKFNLTFLKLALRILSDSSAKELKMYFLNV